MREVAADVVIIGSGAGGGTVAQALAPLCRDGRRVLVLEEGTRLRPGEFTGREVDMARKLYVDSGGMLTRDGSMTLATGRAYGGSTVVYTGTSLPVPASVIEEWAVPGLAHGDVLARSQRFMGENHVHLLEEPEINDNNRLFRDGCRAMGYRVEQFPINVRGCRGSGLCNLGCPNGAKQGTHVVQLPAAEAQGVEVVTGCRVDRIGDREVTATVASEKWGEPPAWEPGEYRVRAPVVVSCGGAVGSSALLLRSGYGDRLRALGRYLTLHPAMILVGEHKKPISNFAGHPKSYYCDHFRQSDGFLLESCMYFPFTTAKNLIGFGSEHSELMHAFDRLQMILVLAVDPALPGNRVAVSPMGEPVVHYRLTDEVLDRLHRAMLVSTRVFFAAGARRVHAPTGSKFFIERHEVEQLQAFIPRRNMRPGRVSITSAHLMGGCRMGPDPSTAVTDAWGRVHGVPWLFVADSALFPKSSEINPYLTVMALADRVAEGILNDVGELFAA